MRTRKTPNMDTIHVVPVAYLGHRQTSMMEPFCENSGFLSLLQNLFNVNNNDKETWSLMFV